MSDSKAVETIDFGDGIYNGETLNGMMHGHGTAKWNSGDTYAGEWKNDVFDGKGVYCWADGDQYSGEYIEEKQQGQGTLKDKTGVYEGQWQNDVREGFGKQTYLNDDIYEGEWGNDLKHGKGKQVYGNGAVYEGEWFRDMHHGVGMMRNSQGDVYEGEFLNNRPHGRGHYHWVDGASYVGYFFEGLKHGEGCERLPNGDWVAGHWINGEHDKKQPLHKADPNEKELDIEDQMSKLNPAALNPMSVEKLKQQTQTGSIDESASSPVTIPAERGATSNNAGGGGGGGGAALNSSTNNYGSSSSLVADSSSAAFTDKDFEGWQPMKMLGKGSYGAVYEAGLTSGKIVCVKIVELGNLTDDGEMQKLQNEIHLMQRLKHPNIVCYYGCHKDTDSNTLNIFMEYVTGGSLNHYIKKFKTIPEKTVQQWAYQMVCGVHYLHGQGIVHRDIKGDNILVTMDGVLKLADFGCSKAIDDVCSKTHGCKTMVGTPYWMAPEVIKCESEGYGVKSDIWSLGCTIVEMVTGKPPWPECNSMWAAVYKIANSTGLPTEIPKDLSADMMNFLELCFERDPNKRASAEKLSKHPWLKL